MKTIIELCDEIEAGYAAGRSLDDAMLNSLIELGDQAALIKQLAAVSEGLLRDVGFGRVFFDTTGSQRLWDVLALVHGHPLNKETS